MAWHGTLASLTVLSASRLLLLTTLLNTIVTSFHVFCQNITHLILSVSLTHLSASFKKKYQGLFIKCSGLQFAALNYNCVMNYHSYHRQSNRNISMLLLAISCQKASVVGCLCVDAWPYTNNCKHDLSQNASVNFIKSAASDVMKIQNSSNVNANSGIYFISMGSRNVVHWFRS